MSADPDPQPWVHPWKFYCSVLEYNFAGVSGKDLPPTAVGRVAWSARLTAKSTTTAPPTSQQQQQQQDQACDIPAVIDHSNNAPVVPQSVVVVHRNMINGEVGSNTSMDSSSSASSSSRNIFEENICSKDDISDISSSCLATSLEGGSSSDSVQAKTGGGGVVFDTKSCLNGPAKDQNANFLTEVNLNLHVVFPLRWACPLINQLSTILFSEIRALLRTRIRQPSGYLNIPTYLSWPLIIFNPIRAFISKILHIKFRKQDCLL